MRKRHAPKVEVAPGAEVGRELEQQQSLRDATAAALVIIIVFGVLWAMLSTLLGRIYPWMTVLLGVLVGLVVRRAGRGIDWRFPVLAAAMTLLGALTGNVVVSAAFTAEALDSTTLDILRAATSMTWPVYFREVLSAADFVFALFGAALAAFFANRKLSRAQFLALRKWLQEKDRDL